MSLPASACPLLLLSATAIACSHTHPAATPADGSALRLTVQADPHVELGALVPGSLPLARVYNVTQAAREAQVVDLLGTGVSPAVLRAGLHEGATAGLAGLHVAPGTAVRVALEQWGISTPLPSHPGSLQVTVQAQLRSPQHASVFARPVTCSRDLTHLAGTHASEGARHADQVLARIPPTTLSAAARALASDCGTRALRALGTR